MTPRLDPRWPPVLVTTSRISFRISAASAGSSSGLSFLMSLVTLIRPSRLCSVLSGEDEIRDLTEPLTFDLHKTDCRLGGGNFPRGELVGFFQSVEDRHVSPPLFVSVQYIIHGLEGKAEVEAVPSEVPRLGGAGRQGPQMGGGLEEGGRLLGVDFADVGLGGE